MDGQGYDATDGLDDQLLARVAKGDQTALEELYEASSTVLFTFALRMLGSREEAADTLQDVYLELWRKAARYDVSRGTPIAWLIALTRQRALERLRARRERTGGKARLQDQPLAPIVELTAPAGESPQVAELRLAVSRSLGTLPAEERQVLEWGYFEGMTSVDMAARLRESLDTVKSRIRQAMQRLRANLRTMGETPPRYGT